MLDVTLCETAPWSQVFALECASLPVLPSLPHNPPLSPSPHCLTLVPHPLLPWPSCPGWQCQHRAQPDNPGRVY